MPPFGSNKLKFLTIFKVTKSELAPMQLNKVMLIAKIIANFILDLRCSKLAAGKEDV